MVVRTPPVNPPARCPCLPHWATSSTAYWIYVFVVYLVCVALSCYFEPTLYFICRGAAVPPSNQRIFGSSSTATFPDSGANGYLIISTTGTQSIQRVLSPGRNIYITPGTGTITLGPPKACDVECQVNELPACERVDELGDCIRWVCCVLNTKYTTVS